MAAPQQDSSIPASTSSSKVYYTYVDEKVAGPYSLRDLVKLQRDKVIRLDTPCCVAGAKEWQNLELMLTHKVGRRRMKKVQRSTFTSFSQKTLPTLVFLFIALLCMAMGVGVVMMMRSDFSAFGYVLILLGFVMLIVAYFVHPKSEK